MREIHTTAVVDETGELDLHLKTDLPAGQHSITLLFDDAQAGHEPRIWSDFPTLSVGGVLPGFSLHREDFYDELEPRIKL